MTAQAALKAALRDVLGPAARSHGYRGSAPNWRKASPAGDWAIVNVQSSPWNSAERVVCVLNLAFAPEPWLRWGEHWSGRAIPRAIPEDFGLYRHSLHPTGTSEGRYGWEVSDERSARSAVLEMVHRLDHDGWPVLDALFSRSVMLERVRDGDLGTAMFSPYGYFHARAEAFLLMDEGLTTSLETSLNYMVQHGMPRHREDTERFVAWVRSEAVKATAG